MSTGYRAGTAAINGWTLRWTLSAGQTISHRGALSVSGSSVMVRTHDGSSSPSTRQELIHDGRNPLFADTPHGSPRGRDDRGHADRPRHRGRHARAGGRRQDPATSTPPAARPASPRTAPPGRCSARTTAPLYQVRRSSDNTTRDIGVLSAGGYANAATQDSFCASTTCLITIIYDQSGRGNHLTQAPPGGFNGPAPGGFDNLANATAAPITIGGQQGVRRLRGPRHRLPQQHHQRHRHRRPARGHVRHLRRHALQRRLLLRLRQRRDQQPRQRQRHDGSHLLRQHQGLGLRHRQRPVDHGRPGERPVLRREPRLQRQRPDRQLPVPDRHHQGRAEPLVHPRRQRAVGRPVDLLQRRAPQRRGLQPDAARKAPSSSASAATTASAPPAPSTRA